MGKYPKSTKGNHYLIVASDICSKWVEAKPIRVATSKHIIKFLEDEVFTRFGFPKVILSDNGSQFISQEFEDACLRWGAIHHTSATYSPRQNQVERRNQSIKDKLRLQLLDQPHNLWDQDIPKILFSMRNSINQATQVAPSQVYFNQLLRHPEEIDVSNSSMDSAKSESLFPYHRKAIHNQEKYVKKYEGEPFQKLHPVGAIVLIRNHELSSAPRGICAAFCPKWCGPFEIIHAYPAGIYICQSLEDPSIQRKVSHQDTQIRYLPALPEETRDISPPSLSPLTHSSGTPDLIEYSINPSLSSVGTPHLTNPSFPILSRSVSSNPLPHSEISFSNSNSTEKIHRPIRTRIFNSRYYGKEWTT